MDKFSELERFMSMLRHPSVNTEEDRQDILVQVYDWFNESLENSEKADVLLYLLGKVNNG